MTNQNKSKLPDHFKPVSATQAKALLSDILSGKDNKNALAVLIASLADPNGDAQKFELAKTLITDLYQQTESFNTSFVQFIRKSRTKATTQTATK